MERLTRKVDGKIVFPSELVGVTPTPNNVVLHELLCRLAAYEDTGLTPAEVKSMQSEWCAMMSVWNSMGNYDRLHDLAEADKDGRLVVLPCRVGDGLWTFCTHPVEQVYSFTVTDISTLNWGTMLNTSRCGVIDARDVGKTVFLTREEAEKALEEAKRDG